MHFIILNFNYWKRSTFSLSKFYITNTRVIIQTWGITYCIMSACDRKINGHEEKCTGTAWKYNLMKMLNTMGCKDVAHQMPAHKGPSSLCEYSHMRVQMLSVYPRHSSIYKVLLHFHYIWFLLLLELKPTVNKKRRWTIWLVHFFCSFFSLWKSDRTNASFMLCVFWCNTKTQQHAIIKFPLPCFTSNLCLLFSIALFWGM